MVIFTVGSIVCGVASSSNMLIGGRAIQGAGGAGMVNGAFTVIATLAPPDKKPSKYCVVVFIAEASSDDPNKCLPALAWLWPPSVR
jgi:MFS family permease